MKIESIKIHNFKAIKNYSGKIGGKNVYLIGGNGKGKTSFIDAVFKGLSGKNLPAVPITDNGKKGLIEIDLGDFLARTKFAKGRPASFELENKNFESEATKFIKSPRTYLESRIGVLDFDVNNFLSLSSLKQVQYVAKYLNVDFSDIDAEIEENEESRRFDKKELAKLKGAQDFYNVEDAQADLIDIIAISKEIEAETAKSANVNRIKDGLTERKKTVLELENRIKILNGEIKDAESWLNNPANALMSDDDLAEKIKSRDNSTATNERIQAAKNARATDSKIEKIESLISESTENIENQRELKAARISAAIKIPELTYNVAEESFLYQGRPFDKNQANTAAQLIVGLKIGAMLLKDLKILRVDASLIDKNEFEKVLSWADTNGIELFVELVDREATQLSINIVDE